MKRSLKLFNKVGKKPRSRRDVREYDEEFEEDFYEDEEYDEEFEDDYGDEDYRDDDEDYRDGDEDYRDSEDDYPEEDYPEDDYPEDDYPEEKSYSREKHGDFDQELREDDDFDVDTNRNVVPFPARAESEDNFSDEDYMEEESYEAEDKYEDARYADDAEDDADYRDEVDDVEADADYRDEVEVDEVEADDQEANYEDEDEDYDAEFEEDYGDQVESRYEDEDDYPEDEEGRYEDDEEGRYEDDEIDDRYDDERDYRDAEEYDRYEEEYDEDYDEDYDRYDEDYRDDEDDYYAAAAVARGGRSGRDSGRSSRASRADKRSRRDRKDRDRRRRGGAGAGAKIIEFVKNTSFAERAAAIVAILLVVGGLITMSFYRDALGRTAEINSFAEVGADMQFNDVIGSTGLLAVADAERARAMTADIIMEEEEEEEEVADDAEGVTIKMTLTSIKSDMKIKFINSETNKLVANVPFEVTVVTPDGTKITYDDHDKDGIIYKNNLTAGKYKITPNALPSEFSNYALELGTQTLTIKDTVETKVVDVSNEIKKESQVNAAKEDTAVQDVVESALTDTVEWVDSNQGSTSGDNKYTYEEVSKDSVASLITGSAIPSGSIRRLSASRGKTQDNPDGDDTNTGDPTQTDPNAGTEPTPDPTQTPDPIKVDKGSVTLEVGGSETVGITGSTEDLKCESSSSSVATANISGTSVEITAVADGDATITVTSKGGSASIAVKVNKKQLSKITFSPSDISVKVGESATVTVNGPSQLKSYSADNSNASLIVNGNVITVKGEKEGTAKVTVEADNYESGSFNVTVNKADPQDMTFDPASVSVKKGSDVKVTVKGPSTVKSCTPADTSAVKTAVNGNVITVTGLKEAKDVKCVVKADGFKDKELIVTVTAADKKDMKVNPSDKKITLKVNDEKTFTVSEPSTIKAVTTDKDKVVKVEKTGNNTVKIKALAKDTAKVTITADDYNDYVIEVVVGDGGDIKLKTNKLTLVTGKTYKLQAEGSISGLKFESSNTGVAKVADDGTITGVAAGEATIKVTATGYKDATATVKVINDQTLKDKNGNVLWVKQSDGSYREAKYSDYFNPDIKVFYLRKENKDGGTRYGWWTIDGKTYYYDKNGNKVTGEQVIKGAKYSFNGDGVLSSSSGTLGIDVSKWNGNIDWNKVKNNGVNFVIIRCGYRGSSAGALIEDPKFRANIKGAQAAGLRVGVYFFSQAVNEVEAVEEASMCINLCKGYSLSFPIYIDVEGSNGRGDTISASQRTANIKAFCGTVQSAGYRAGVYSNKTWFTKNINTASLTNYKIWLAQYAANVSYTATRYDMWQYTSKGSVSGISGNVDMNILYN